MLICEIPVNSVVKHEGKLYAVVEFIHGKYNLEGETGGLFLEPDTAVELIATPASLALWFAGVKAGDK